MLFCHGYQLDGLLQNLNTCTGLAGMFADLLAEGAGPGLAMIQTKYVPGHGIEGDTQ